MVDDIEHVHKSACIFPYTFPSADDLQNRLLDKDAHNEETFRKDAFDAWIDSE